MKKRSVLFLLVLVAIVMSACGNPEITGEEEEVVVSDEHEGADGQLNDVKTAVSGSFTVGVRAVIPDYCSDDTTLNVAVVTEYQSYPFTIFVGEEIGSQLEVGEVYVFTIKPIVVDCAKESLEKMELSSLAWELPGFEITDFRLANEEEIGMGSLRLTIEESAN